VDPSRPPAEKELAFTLVEYHARLARVAAQMSATGLDALVVAAPEDLLYLTGFRSMDIFRFQALLVTPKEEPLMVVRKVARASFERTSWTRRVMTYADHKDPGVALAAALAELGTSFRRVGVPKQSPYFTPHVLEQAQAAVAAEWVDATTVVSRQRWVKSPTEVAYIRQACRYAEAALWAGVRACRPGRTENHVAAAMLAAMVEAGSETPAKNPLLGAGPRSALGHVSWEGRPIAAGDVVFLEPGACVRRYHAALMRCAVVGSPRGDAERWAHACRDAVNAAMGAMRPGVAAAMVDRACRQSIRASGLGELFHHRTGYSIGLGFSNWIEDLSLREGEDTPLEAGMAFHVVPFLSDGRQGVAVSEMVHVTEHGAERLTDVPQELLAAPD
jgi:Xaa-Pro dipeptidase